MGRRFFVGEQKPNIRACRTVHGRRWKSIKSSTDAKPQCHAKDYIHEWDVYWEEQKHRVPGVQPASKWKYNPGRILNHLDYALSAVVDVLDCMFIDFSVRFRMPPASSLVQDIPHSDILHQRVKAVFASWRVVCTQSDVCLPSIGG